jgi:hypothetical protein
MNPAGPKEPDGSDVNNDGGDDKNTGGSDIENETKTGGGAGDSGQAGGGGWTNTGDNPGNPNAPGYHSGVGGGDSGGGPSELDPEALVSPILMDLDGNGITITELSKSSVYLDGGDGREHRTAWAGSGDGVLFFDAGMDSKITEQREFVFTEWSQGSTSDFEALREAFDTNGDGKLSGTELAPFKVMVTNPDGTIVAKTLAELGITEIKLTPDATHIELPDGSVITGQSTFIKDGQTRTVADTTLAMDAEGHRVVRVVTDLTGGAFQKEIRNTAYTEDGKIAFVHKVLSKADGSHVRHSFDDKGDGAVIPHRRTAA